METKRILVTQPVQYVLVPEAEAYGAVYSKSVRPGWGVLLKRRKVSGSSIFIEQVEVQLKRSEQEHLSG